LSREDGDLNESGELTRTRKSAGRSTGRRARNRIQIASRTRRRCCQLEWRRFEQEHWYCYGTVGTVIGAEKI
jgi:hypothetical protein